MPLLEDPTATQAFNGGPPPVTPESKGGLLDDPTAGQAFSYKPDEGSGYVAAGGKATWGDVGQAVKAGLHEAGSTIASDFASHAYTPEAVQRWQGIAEGQRAATKEAIAGETSGGQQAREGSFFAHPLLQGAEQAPALAAAAAPAIAGGAIAGPIGAAIGGAAAFGEQSRGQAVDEFTQKVMDTPATTLMEQPAFKALIDSGMPEDEAKRQFAHDQSAGLALQSEALGAAAGALGPAAEFGGLGASKIITDKITGRVLTGGLEGATTLGAQGAGQTAISGQAEQQAGIGPGASWVDIARGGWEGAKAGAIFGAVGGVSAHPTRSETEYRKPEAQPGATTSEGETAPPLEKQGPAAPVNPVDPTQAAGLSGKPITPESKAVAPPEPPIQPEVVQIQPVINREGQGQANTTGRVGVPQPEAKIQPLPRAVEPERVQAEPDASIRAQHADLIDKANPREAVVYPPDTQPIDLPNKSRYGQGTLADGRTIQYDRSGPSKLTKAKVQYADENNRLNEILQLGPINKDEAVERTRQGEQGAVVTERAPDHTEVKAAAGTTDTAPAQIEALAATKAPENTVQVERPEDVIADRQAQVAQEQSVQPQVVVTPESKPLAETPRVLQDVSPEGVAARDMAVTESARQAQTVAEQLKAREAANQETVSAGKHRSKEEVAKATSHNIAAEKIANAHPAVDYSNEKANLDRARAMVAEANKAKVVVPSLFREGMQHNPSMLKLREAMDYIKHPDDESYGRFVHRESLIDQGKWEEALQDRRREGEMGLGSVGMDKADVESVPQPHELEKPEDVAEHIERETEIEQPKTEVHARPDKGEAMAAALVKKRAERVAREEAEVAAKVSERVRVPQKEDTRAETVTAGRMASGFKQEVRKSRAIKRRAMDDEGHSGTIMGSDVHGDPIALNPTRSTTLREAVNEHFDVKRYSPELRPMMERLRDAVMKLAGDTDVHYVPHDELTRAAGEKAHGLYDPYDDHVLLNADNVRPDTALHEAFHAATSRAFEKDPHLQGLMDRLQNEMGIKGESEEFLTRLMTEADMQARFKATKISPELARDIGIPKWRKATMWEGALNVIRNALGLGPRDVSAIEAAMSISEKAMWKRDPGMAMEAGARSLGVRLQKIEPVRVEPPQRDQEAFLKSPMDHIKAAASIDRKIATEFAKEKYSNVSQSLIGKTAKVLSGTQLSDIHGRLFKDAKGNIIEAINRARDKVAHVYNEARTKDRDTVNRGYLLDQQFKSKMADYAELINLSSRYNIHADKPAAKVPKDPVKAAKSNWQRDANYDKARKIYDSLPAELQRRYSTEKQFYQDKQKELANTVLDKTLPLLDLPKDMEARARANDLTDDDWAHLEKNKVDAPIRAAYRLLNKNDVYFNSHRNGDFVVTGKYEMPKGGKDTSYSGELLKDNQREFNTEADAHKYVTDTHMPATVREAHYWTDPATGKTERVSADEAVSSGKVETKYQVTLERQHTEFHDTHSDAVKARAEMDKAGVGELSNVLDRRNESAWSSIGTGDQQALERRIKSRDDLSPAEKDHLINSTRALTAGTSGMAPHLLQSRKVAGAKFDTAQGLDAYSRAINQHIARNAHSTELRQAMTRLNEHEDANRGDTDAYRRSVIGNEMRDRVYNDANVGSTKASPLLHRLMTLSFIDFLVRPSHVFLSQVHPYVYSVPMMAGRHGYWKAIQAQKTAMKDLGGQLANLKRGAMRGADIVKSLREKDTDKAVALAHGGDPIHEMITRLSNKDERDALMKMYETGHLHSAYETSMFTGGGLDRTNATMQQFTNAMEANNRLSTALAAYRLEKEMHPDNALAYAQRVIEETHGVYSQANIARIFKNPLLRATLQFHQQPMNLAIMLYRNMAKAAHGDKEASWTLAYQLGTAAMLGGMGGMPLDLPKLAGIATSPLTGAGPSDWNDKMRRMLADTIGPEATNVVMEGLPGLMGPLGPSLGHRMGFDAGILNDEPKSGSSKDVISWVAKNLAGAPGSVIKDWLDAAGALEKGDYQGMAEKALPGSLKDFAKAYREATVGKVVGGKTIREASYGDAILQTLGFSGVERERQMEGHYALQKALQEASAAKKETVGEKLKQAQRDRMAKGRRSVLGVPTTPQNRALQAEYGKAYQ